MNLSQVVGESGNGLEDNLSPDSLPERAPMRLFIPADFMWLKPIALKFDEWESVRDILLSRDKYILLCAWVIEGKTVVAMYEDREDPEGVVTRICGLCDTNGIKDLFRLGRSVVMLARGFRLKLHSPKLDHEGWQLSFYEKMGFVKGQDNTYVLWK